MANYNYISTATTTQVATGEVTLKAIVVTETSAGSIKIIDGTAGSTANVGELKASIVEGTYEFDCRLTQGLRIITAGDSKITVIYE